MVGREVLLRVDKSVASPGERASPSRELARARRSRPRGRPRRLVLRPRGRDRRDRGSRRERPDAADRGAHGASGNCGGSGRDRGSRPHGLVDEQDSRLGRGPHPGGPAATRARARVQPRRELRTARLRSPAELAFRLAATGTAARPGREAREGVRRPGRRSADVRRLAVGREPAESRRRPRGRRRSKGPDRSAADARPRRRGNRVRAPASRGGAGRRTCGPAGLARAGRGARSRIGSS